MDAASSIEILNKLNLVLANQAEILARLEALHARLDILSPPPQPLVRQTAVLDDATPRPVLGVPPPPPQSLLVLKRQNAQLGDEPPPPPPAFHRILPCPPDPRLRFLNVVGTSQIEIVPEPPPALPLSRQNAVPSLPFDQWN